MLAFSSHRKHVCLGFSQWVVCLRATWGGAVKAQVLSPPGASLTSSSGILMHGQARAIGLRPSTEGIFSWRCLAVRSGKIEVLVLVLKKKKKAGGQPS